MQRLLPFLAVLAIAGCGLNAAVTEPPTEDAAVTEETPPPSGQEVVMHACRVDAPGTCMDVSVLTDGTSIQIMRHDAGWVLINDSSCIDGLCEGTDENGVSWTFEQ